MITFPFNDDLLFSCLFEGSFLFEDDLYISNHYQIKLPVYSFSGAIEKDFYLKDFTVQNKFHYTPEMNDVFHMRIDPPYNMKYQQYLWQLDFLKESGVRIVNDPKGIMYNNEKIVALKNKSYSVDSFVGST